MAECRVKVLRRMVVPDLAEEYIGTAVGPCPLLSEGQEFVVSSALAKPPGFCDWAWNDILRFVVALSRGGNFSQDIFEGWMKTNDRMIACCTDGIRPVVFEIQRLTC
jgi:uncharacterized repeat protein (TIGR04076 family)